MLSKNKNYIFIITFVLIVLSLIMTGVKTKKSFQYVEHENVDLINYKIFNNYSNQVYYDKLDNIEDIFNKTPIILKVKMTNEREVLNQTVLSTVIIEKVYKSEIDISINDSIYLYEPITIQENTGSIYTTGGYIPMVENKEYIVFLKSLKIPDGYSMSDKEKVSFMYYNPTYGKVSIENLEPYILKENDNIELRDILINDIMINENEINNYLQYKDIILKYID